MPKTLPQQNNEILLAKEENLVPETGAWLKRKAELEEKFPITIPQFQTESITKIDDDGVEKTATLKPLSAQSVIKVMDQELLKADRIDDAIFTTGVGIHQMVAAQLITWTQPRQMLSSGSLGTMGVSLGYCIGAKLANDKKFCISVDGDGSFAFLFDLLELASRAQARARQLTGIPIGDRPRSSA